MVCMVHRGAVCRTCEEPDGHGVEQQDSKVFPVVHGDLSCTVAHQQEVGAMPYACKVQPQAQHQQSPEKKKKGVTGRTRSYAATNPWKEGL
jgi:hypothetical protein